MEEYKIKTDGSIRLINGKKFNLWEPEPENIDIECIAVGLANTCRFAGQLKKYYSVAEHSYRVSYMVHRDFALDALLHDASEAFMCDLPRPFKERMPEYRQIEDRLEEILANRFGVRYPVPKEVKDADAAICETEKASLRDETDVAIIVPMTSYMAEKKFLERYYKLTEGNV